MIAVLLGLASLTATLGWVLLSALIWRWNVPAYTARYALGLTLVSLALTGVALALGAADAF